MRESSNRCLMIFMYKCFCAVYIMSCHRCSHQTTLFKLGVWFMIHSPSLTSPGDAESASLAAVHVKASDSFSIADSALGGSSAVSLTTAGVTQFSEVRLIMTDNCQAPYNSNILFIGSV